MHRPSLPCHMQGESTGKCKPYIGPPRYLDEHMSQATDMDDTAVFLSIGLPCHYSNVSHLSSVYT